MMPSNIGKNPAPRKRCNSVTSSKPTKRLKRHNSMDTLSTLDLQPHFKELHAVELRREKIINNNKKLIQVVDEVLVLSDDIRDSLTDFKRDFNVHSLCDIVSKSGSLFVLNFLARTKKSIEQLCDYVHNGMEGMFNKPSDTFNNCITEEPPIKKFNLSLIKDSELENTDDEFILFSNNHIVKSNQHSLVDDSKPATSVNCDEVQDVKPIDNTYNDLVDLPSSVYTIPEVNENDDACSIHSHGSQMTVANVFLNEALSSPNVVLNEMDTFSLQKTDSFIESEVTDCSEATSEDGSFVFDISAISLEDIFDDNLDGEEAEPSIIDGSETLLESNSCKLPEIDLSLNEKLLLLTNDEISDDLNEHKDLGIEIIPSNHIDDLNQDLNDISEIGDETPINTLEEIIQVYEESNIYENTNLYNFNDALVQNVAVVPNDEHDQLEFLQYFGLKYNIIEVDDDEMQDDCEDMEDTKTKAALKILRKGKCALCSLSSSLSSLSSDSYISDLSDDELLQTGRIINKLPSLPPSSGSETEYNDICVTNTNVDKLKACKIILEKIHDGDSLISVFNNEVPSNVTTSTLNTSNLNNKEINDINRLTNLTTIDNSKIKENSNFSVPKTGNDRKLETVSRNATSDIEDYIEDNDESFNISFSDISQIDKNELRKELEMVRAIANTNNEEEEEDEFEIIDTDPKRKNILNDSDKENKENSKELSADEIAKRKWRNDKLLRGKITDSDSENETSKPKKDKERIKGGKNDDTDKESMPNDNHILIDSDSYDSEIEFVSETKKKRSVLNRKGNIRNSIQVSSSDKDSSSSSSDNDNSDEDTANSKKGRKNIRPILSDEILEETTKKAVLVENIRKERLSQKQKDMDNFLSQTSLSSQSTGLVLDVDVINQKSTIVVHPTLTKRLKPHQDHGVRFMWESCYESVTQLKKDSGSGCILAHCMGLGKTFQVVTLIHTLFAHSSTNTKHVLVVCPLSIVLNWKTEFESGLQNLHDGVNINIFNISESNRSIDLRIECILRWRHKTGVLIMGYETYQRLIKFKDPENLDRGEIKLSKALIDPGPDLVILDEGHLLKNGKINRTLSLMKIKTQRRIVLTGTPLQNNLKEYYYMVRFVKPNLLGSYHEYTNRFVNPITNGQFHDSTDQDIKKMKMRSHVLHKMLKATIQRYEVTELKCYLPPRYDYALFVELHPVQIEFYLKYLDIATKKESGKMNLFCDYHVLQYISTHPYLLFLKGQKKPAHKKGTKEVDIINLDVDPDTLEIVDGKSAQGDWWRSLYPQDCSTNIQYGPKFNVMLTIIRESEKLGDKLLIFTSSLVELDAIEHYLQLNETETSKWKIKEDYYRLDGAVPPETRLHLCNLFNNKRNKQARVFIISHKVGGLGLNLMAANRVILMDVSWNPAVDNQSVFRSYRFGQEKKCYVYRLVAMGTMEQVMYDRQVTKSAIARRVVDEKEITRLYKKDELEDMYRVKFHLYKEKKPPCALPEDSVLKGVLSSHKEVSKYHEHNELLQNQPDEQLNEDQMKMAWDEYNKEQENDKIEQQRKKAAAAATAAAAVAASAAASSAATTTLPAATLPTTNVRNIAPKLILATAASATAASSAATATLPAATLPTTNLCNSMPKWILATAVSGTAASAATAALPAATLPMTTTTNVRSSTPNIPSTADFAKIAQKFHMAFNNTVKDTNPTLATPESLHETNLVPCKDNNNGTIGNSTAQKSAELQHQYFKWADAEQFKRNPQQTIVMPKIVNVTSEAHLNNKVLPNISATKNPINKNILGGNPRFCTPRLRPPLPVAANTTKSITNKSMPIQNIPRLGSNLSAISNIPTVHINTSNVQAPPLVPNRTGTIPTRNLGYTISPNMLLAATTGSKTLQNTVKKMKNLYRTNSQKTAHSSNNYVSNVTRAHSSNNIPKNGSNSKFRQTNEVIEITDTENQDNSTVNKEHDAWMASLQQNSNITLSTVGKYVTRQRSSSTKSPSTHVPPISITHENASISKNVIIEID